MASIAALPVRQIDPFGINDTAIVHNRRHSCLLLRGIIPPPPPPAYTQEVCSIQNCQSAGFHDVKLNSRQTPFTDH